MSEFDGDEYKSAKVDPVAQFSKPVAVAILTDHVFYYVFYKSAYFDSNLSVIWQSHMNKDHGEDTKVIVQHWTSVPVCHFNHC